MITNWKGQEQHAIDNYCWFLTDDKDRQMMIQLYNVIVGTDKKLGVHLDRLLEMSSIESLREAEFNFNCND